MSYYIKGKSKKEINEAIRGGKLFEVIKYDIYGGDVFDLERLPAGTALKIFEKYVSGNPYAKSYATLAFKDGLPFLK